MTDGDTSTPKKDDVVSQALEKAGPAFANLSFGGLMGFCSGMALKKIGRAMAIVIGTGFVALQLAVSSGYIEGVNYTKIRDDCAKTLDINKDGKLDEKDAKEWWEIFKNVMVHKLPSAGGFSLGFLYGVKTG